MCVSDDGKSSRKLCEEPRVIGLQQGDGDETRVLFGIQAWEDSMVSSYPWQIFYAQMRPQYWFF